MNKNIAIPLNIENLKQVLSKEFLLVILISIPSAIVADFLHIPLAWMLGPMIATSIAALSGLKIIMPRIILSFILIFLGLYIGNYIDQNLINQIGQWFWTSLVMLGYIIISVIFVSKYLEKFSGYNKKTSIFSAAPGALGPLLILAEHEKSDLSQVATSHLIRLIIIITLFPFIVDNFSQLDSNPIPEFNFLNQNHFDLLILIISSIILIVIFDKLKIPAPLLSGTLVASGILQISDVASYKLPDQSIDFCLLMRLKLAKMIGAVESCTAFVEYVTYQMHQMRKVLLKIC